MDTQNLQLSLEQFSLQKTCKLTKQLIHNKGQKEHIEAGERGRDVFSPKTPPLAWQPRIRRNLTNMELLSEEQEVCTPHQSLDLHQRDEPPKHLIGTNKAYVQEIQSAIMNKSFLTLDSHTVSFIPGPVQKQQFERDSSANLKLFARVAGVW